MKTLRSVTPSIKIYTNYQLNRSVCRASGGVVIQALNAKEVATAATLAVVVRPVRRGGDMPTAASRPSVGWQGLMLSQVVQG